MKPKMKIHLFTGMLVFALLFAGCEDNDQPVYGANKPDPNPTGKAAATITGIMPTVGFLKDEIVINGSGFDTEPSFNMVRFGNKVGTVTAATATSLTVITPNVNDATVDVQVAVKGSEFWSNNSAFTFLPTLELLAEDINWANGIEVDDNNNVYIGARNDGQIIKIAPDGTRSVFADVPVGGQLRFGPGGYLYVCAVDENKVIRVSADGSSIEDYAFADAAVSIDWDAAGNTYIVSRDAGINVMDTGGNMTYIDLDGAPVKNCRVFDGYLYINRIWDGTITRFPITGGSLGAEEPYLETDGLSPSSFDFDENGVMYWAHAWEGNLYTLNPDGTPGETLYEGELYPNDSPMRYMTFRNRAIYAAFPCWGGDCGAALKAYIGVQEAPNYGRD